MDSSAYLDRASVFSLARLREEPGRLESELGRLRQEMEIMSVRNYSAHIDNHRCLHAGMKGLNAMVSTLSGFQDVVLGVNDEGKQFLERAPHIVAEHKRYRSTLEQYAHLLELLEIPQLMDACVKRQAYDNALRLATFVQKLVKRHTVMYTASSAPGDRGGLTLIVGVDRDVQHIVDLMQGQLIQILCGTMGLPVCVRTVGYLRRVLLIKTEWRKQRSSGLNDGNDGTGQSREVSPRLDLDRTFLECRSNFIRSELAKLSQDEPAEYVVRCIERRRLLLSDVIIQYNAIFGDDSDADIDKTRLQDWVMEHVQGTTRMLGKMLPLIEDGGSLSNVFEQAMYMGQSLGKFGADFRPLLVPLCEDTVYKLANRDWSQALELFQKQMRQIPWMDIDVRAIVKDSKKESFASPPSEGGSTDQVAKSLSAPSRLLHFPSFGQFTNVITASLNEIRQVALISLRYKLSSRMFAIFRELIEIVKVEKPKECDSDKKLNVRYGVYCEHGLRVCISHLCRLFRMVYGEEDGGYTSWYDGEREGVLMALTAFENNSTPGMGVSPTRPKRNMLDGGGDDENDEGDVL